MGEQFSMDSPEPGKLVIQWKNKGWGSKGKANDKAFVACFSEDSKTWTFEMGLVMRKAGIYKLDMADPGRSTHVYFGFD